MAQLSQRGLVDFVGATETRQYKDKTFVEAADADDIWGIGTYITDEVMAFNEDVWMGTNLLGKTLTRVRDEHL